MEVSEVFHHEVELCWNTTKAFQHGSPVTEYLGIIPTPEAFENGRPAETRLVTRNDGKKIGQKKWRKEGWSGKMVETKLVRQR